MYQENFGANPPALATKHIFVGETRIASKLHYRDQTGGTRALFMERNTYWYHADHLGSTNWVTDHEGEGYEHFQYTPYGESWISEQLGDTVFTMTHRVTGQELDPETGLYAFPARNYDPRTSRWLSVDPAMEAFLPYVGQNPDDLPGMGGVFDPTNLVAYHYASNSPTRFIDPSGSVDWDAVADGLISTITGVGKTIVGVGIVSASGGGAVLSGGAATPVAIAGIAVGGAFAVDGFVEATTGAATLLAGLSTASDDIGHEDVPTSMSQMVGMAADAYIEVVSGKETDVMENVGEWIGQQPAGVVDLLLLPTDVGAPGSGGMQGADNLDQPRDPSLEMERP